MKDEVPPYVAWVLGAIYVLFGLGVYLDSRTLHPGAILEPDIGLTYFSIAVDIVIGIFTIIGLYWAGKQFADFAVKPFVLLHPGTDILEDSISTNYNSIPIQDSGNNTYPIKGRSVKKETGYICESYIGFLLSNEKPKAGRNIYIDVLVTSDIKPTPCEFRYSTGLSLHDPPRSVPSSTVGDAHHLGIRFNDSLVVYEHDYPTLIGNLKLNWVTTVDSRPNWVKLITASIL